MNSYVVDKSFSNLRIDKYLATVTDYSRNKIVKLIKEGLVLVDSDVVKPSYTVTEGEVVEIIGELKNDNSLIPEKIPLNIVYEDNDVIIVNKPSGMVVHPANGNYTHTLVNALLYYTDHLSNSNDVRPGIIHRIDKDTSGLLMVAKNDYAHKVLSEQLSKHSTKRKYIALVWGIINHDTGTINAPIGRDEKNR